MIYQLVIPGPIEDLDEVRVLHWHRGEADALTPGSLLVELETQKSIVEVRPAADGFLRRILCPANQWQKLGQPLALVSDAADEPLPAPLPPDLPLLGVEFDVS